MQEAYKKQILKYLQTESYSPMKLAKIAQALEVPAEYYPDFQSAFHELRRAGHVIIGARNLVDLRPMGSQVIGTFRANTKGFGFVIPQEPNAHGDLFIPPEAVGSAMTGDIVLAHVFHRHGYSPHARFKGEIIQIIERAHNRFVGTLTKQNNAWLVYPDGSAFFDPIYIEDTSAKTVKDQDKVVIEILTYPTQATLARGVIIEVLGRAGQYDCEIKSIIHQYHLREEFSEECWAQARKAALSFPATNGPGRKDISDQTIVTIDPPDAKDFDDAISLSQNSKGQWVLGVHIADVSYFIPADTPMDQEAAQRGNSVYLPGKTIPMIPEILSNGICSLQPNQPRFTKSVYLTYDNQGKILALSFENSIICSKQRLTYEQANAILQDQTNEFPTEINTLVKNMEILSRIIEQRRKLEGMLHLALKETDLILDESGRVVDAVPADDSYPHTIIEMFMVEANEAVASLLDRLDIPFMRRIHPEPDPISMKNLTKLLKTLGFSLPRQPDRFAIQALLQRASGHDNELAVNLAVLRSMEKAVYAPRHIGHYALASIHYCHFTSPIRRYADLLVHRVLQYHLEGRMDQARQFAASLDLNEIGSHISFTERNAEDAERELKMVLILQLLSEHIGETLDCVVTGLTQFGIFVQSRKYNIEGLIRTADLGPEHWKYNDKTHSMVGQQSGTSIHLGQPIHVRIASINIPARQLNVVPADPLPVPKNTKKTSQQSKTRRPTKRSRKGKQR